MKSATYYIVHFTKADKFVGIAHNYDEAVLISTLPHEHFMGAMDELEQTAVNLEVELRWFDGEYECAGRGDQMITKLEAQRRRLDAETYRQEQNSNKSL